MGYLKLKSVLQRYFPTPNINYSNLNHFSRDATGALRASMSRASMSISGDDTHKPLKLTVYIYPPLTDIYRNLDFYIHSWPSYNRAWYNNIAYLSCFQNQLTDAFTEQILAVRASQLSEKIVCRESL